MVANVGIAVKIGSQAQSVHFFPFPVLLGDILIFGISQRLATSGDVGQCRQYHILLWRGRKYGCKSWNRGAICHRSKIISTPGLMAAILNVSRRTTSGNLRGDVVKSGMVDNMGIAVGIAAPSLAVQKLFHFRFLLTAVLNFCGLPSSTNVGQPQAVSPVSSRSRAWSKM